MSFEYDTMSVEEYGPPLGVAEELERQKYREMSSDNALERLVLKDNVLDNELASEL
jgi:hypothetical protein